MTREKLFIIVLILIAAFMRLYRFETFMEFLGDQGRDAIVVKRILIDRDLTLLGPGTSVGKMYLGPLYYYAMVPFLALSYPQPTGPAYAVALLGILTAVLVYWLGKQMVGKTAAGIAALLYAVSPTIVALSRFSWQPNPAPFFGLLMLWLSWKAYRERRPWLWVGVAACFAILSQLHYVALLAGIPAGITFLAQCWKAHKPERKSLIFAALAGMVLLGVSTLPLLFFDLRHDHLIVAGFRDFLEERSREQWTVLERLRLTAVDSHGVGMRLTAELMGFSKELRRLNTVIAIAIAILCIKALFRSGTKHHARIDKIPVLWLFLTILALSAYRQSIYNHYYAFIFPIAMLAIGISIRELQLMKVLPQWLIYGGIALGVGYLIATSPYFGTPPVGLKEIRASVAKILPSITPTERYNIASLNEQHEYKGLRYRYFFDVSKNPAQNQYDYDNLDKLVVIVENTENPLQSPIYEIQRFLSAGGTLTQVIPLYDAAKAYIYIRQQE